MAIAIFNPETNSVLTVVESVPDGWPIPPGYQALPEDELPADHARETPQEPGPQWIKFGVAALAAPQLVQLFEALPSLMESGLTIGLGKAIEGDPRFFSRAWTEIGTSGLIPQGTTEFVVALARGCNLPQDFIAALQGD